jgi:hypothetical protein
VNHIVVLNVWIARVGRVCSWSSVRRGSPVLRVSCFTEAVVLERGTGGTCRLIQVMIEEVWSTKESVGYGRRQHAR